MLQNDLRAWLHATSLETEQRIIAMVRPVDSERLGRRPAPTSWSAAEVLEHLCISDELYDDRLRDATTRARPDPAASRRTWKPTWLGYFIARALENPRPLKAPRAFRIGPSPRQGVLEAFVAREQAFARTIEACASLDWRRVKLASPAAPSFLRFNLGDAFRIHVVHVKRHATQMERALGAM